MTARKYRFGLSRREFARRDGCSEMLVRRAIDEGRLSTLADDSIDPALVGTGWRKSNTQADANPPGANRRHGKNARVDANTTTRDANTAASVDDALKLFEQQAGVVTERMLQGATYADALRIKENYLALLRQLEYAIKSGAVIDLAEAEQTVFDTFRAVRDAWLNWPARVAPLIAADLEFDDVDRLGVVLAAHVHTQLASMGEPQIDFS